MQCSSCHKEIQDEAAFCGYCGASVVAASAEHEQTLIHENVYVNNYDGPPQSATTFDVGAPASYAPYPPPPLDQRQFIQGHQPYYEQTAWDLQHPPMQTPRRQNNRLPLILGVILVIVIAGVGTLVWSSAHQSSSLQTQGQAQTQPSPTATPDGYPSKDEVQSAISYFYTHESDFAGKQVIQQFTNVTYGPLQGSKSKLHFVACAQYQYASAEEPNKPLNTARHTFTFHYENEAWKVTNMGNWNSC